MVYVGELHIADDDAAISAVKYLGIIGYKLECLDSGIIKLYKDIPERKWYDKEPDNIWGW